MLYKTSVLLLAGCASLLMESASAVPMVKTFSSSFSSSSFSSNGVDGKEPHREYKQQSVSRSFDDTGVHESFMKLQNLPGHNNQFIIEKERNDNGKKKHSAKLFDLLGDFTKE